MRIWKSLVGALIGAGVLVSAANAEPFTYQGKLQDGSEPANGDYDMRFELFGSNLVPIGASISIPDVPVKDGVFSVSLDFGTTAFVEGTGQYLSVSVRDGASVGGYTQLLPYTRINSVPVAQYVLNQEVKRFGSSLHLGNSSNRLLINPALSSDGFVNFSSGLQYNFNGNGFGGTYINGNSTSSIPYYGFAVNNSAIGYISMNISGVINEMKFYTANARPLLLNNYGAEVAGDITVSGDVKAIINNHIEQVSPLAFGVVSSTGAVEGGTGNFTAVWSSAALRYEIAIDGEPFFFDDYTTIATSTGGSPLICSVASASSKLLVYIYDLNGNKVQNRFNFTVYRNEPE